ncbi:MAG: phosphoribosylformylglycinamidine cyclo-ligase [Verrucomicrobiales bacterium]|nr:phosphoribosylformylglycinamidine cyclo-ligase [Verrucomicrobiales bacterium]
MRRKQKAYAAAGVDIDLGNRVKGTLPKLLASTHRREVLGKVGGFGGLFALDLRRHPDPILVSSVDGVGTKLKIAFAMDRHDTIGQDLVNHCVNDIAVLGAEPLFFLDYLGTGKLEPHVFKEIIQGFARACAENHCALIGGETAQMPGFYQAGEYDVSGTIVGVVDRSAILDGRKSVRRGDIVLGMASSGLHTNGYSLARRILFEKLGLTPKSRIPGCRGSLGDELLKVHVSYGPAIQSLLRKFAPRTAAARKRQGTGGPIHAFAHITGGGFVDNIPRVLPDHCDVVIRKGSWPLPPLFQLLASQGGVDEAELYQVFNMGIGMVAIVDRESVSAVLRHLRKSHDTVVIGEVTQGTGRARVE